MVLEIIHAQPHAEQAICAIFKKDLNTEIRHLHVLIVVTLDRVYLWQIHYTGHDAEMRANTSAYKVPLVCTVKKVVFFFFYLNKPNSESAFYDNRYILVQNSTPDK